MLSFLATCVLSLVPTDWYVNPEVSSGSGTSVSNPSPTLGAVLAQAQFGDTVFVLAPTSADTSIAPANAAPVGSFQGKEGDFPLAIPAGIRIVGVSGSFGPPKVRIATTATAPYPHWNNVLRPFPFLVPASQRAYFKLAYAVTLENLVFDGSRYLYKKLEENVPGAGNIPAPLGVLAQDCRNVAVIGCRFEDLQDGLVFRETRGALTSGVVLSSTFTGSFPQESFPAPGTGNPNDRGHAGLRVEVARVDTLDDGGIVSVQVGSPEGSGCAFSGNHDGLETGSDAGDFVTLGVYESSFTCNESAMELVGDGTNTIDIRGCTFERNYNKTICEGGYPTFKGGVCGPTPLGAVLQPRNAGIHRVTIRESSFCNNALGVYWVSQSSESLLDLGTTSDPGLNTFSLAWTSTSSPPPYTVGLFTKAQGQVVKAAGNLWIDGNLGSLPGGFYRGLRRGTTPAAANVWIPPGCADQSAWFAPTTSLGPPSATVGRNYSQLGAFPTGTQPGIWASIDFGFVGAGGVQIDFPQSVLDLQHCTPAPCPCVVEATGCVPWTGCP
jgi:hypothetical protein